MNEMTNDNYNDEYTMPYIRYKDNAKEETCMIARELVGSHVTHPTTIPLLFHYYTRIKNQEAGIKRQESRGRNQEAGMITCSTTRHPLTHRQLTCQEQFGRFLLIDKSR
jgi:hypothetical protein